MIEDGVPLDDALLVLKRLQAQVFLLLVNGVVVIISSVNAGAVGNQHALFLVVVEEVIAELIAIGLLWMVDHRRRGKDAVQFVVIGDDAGGLKGNGVWYRPLLLGGGGGAEGVELIEDELELGEVMAELALELLDDAEATGDGVGCAHVRLVYDGLHGDGALAGLERADELLDVTDAEQAVGVLELGCVLRREERREEAIGPASPALEFADCAGLACAAAAAAAAAGGEGGGAVRGDAGGRGRRW